MLGQLSFHSNLNERAFSKLKSEFSRKRKGKGRNKKIQIGPRGNLSAQPRNQPTAHSAS
jgi:hypothetical protein